MEKWEYTTREWSWREDADNLPEEYRMEVGAYGHWTWPDIKDSDEIQGMNLLGKNGWELVAVVQRATRGDWSGRLYYFKRK